MATHSSVLAWRTPGTGEPGGLPSVGRTELDTIEATQQQQQCLMECGQNRQNLSVPKYSYFEKSFSQILYFEKVKNFILKKLFQGTGSSWD